MLLLKLFLFVLPHFIQATYYQVTEQVYFDVTIDKKHIGRIVIGLFGEIAPKTVRNFETIATEGINGTTYAGSKFHRVVNRFMIQGGDIVNGNGSGSVSIYGKHFNDENFDVKHTTSGFVSMANKGKNTNGCQFFITTISTPWLNGKHTVFGKVVEGNDVVHKIENVKTDVEDRPLKPIIIKKCGLVPTPTPFEVSDEPYDLWAWIKSSIVPVGFSMSILGFFHWVMKKLDVLEEMKYKST